MSVLDWTETARDPRLDPLRGRTVLVTGGGGFIGSHLVDALLALHCRVTLLDNLATGRPGNIAHLVDPSTLGALEEAKPHPASPASRAPRIFEPSAGPPLRIVLGDLRDRAACAQAVEGAAFVFHQAALGSVPRSLEHPAETFGVNVAGTARLFEAARDAKVRRVVYASSSSVYGDSERLPKKEGEEGNPLSPYALTKVMNERLAEIYTRCYGMHFVGLRYFNVYGPRQDPDGPYAAVIPRFIKACRSGEAPVIYGDGEQTRDFTFVQDAVRANLLAAVAPVEACGRSYNVAGGKSVPILELARAVRQVVGRGAPPRHEPPRPGDVRHSLADLALAARALAYQPAISLEEGLAVLSFRP